MIPSGRANDTTHTQHTPQTMDKIALILLVAIVGLTVYRRARVMGQSLRDRFDQGNENA